MDEEKKSEASWDEPKQVGPYQLQEEVEQDDASRWECYRATHVTSGAQTLVFKRASQDEKGSRPLPDFRAHLTSSAAEGSFAPDSGFWHLPLPLSHAAWQEARRNHPQPGEWPPHQPFQ
jgi:hypothetical protein